ncbi:hypothetical protein ABE488_12910 [Luteimonas sp. TWI662]|uniref:hypothetical protein n=1 Tax=Luteimonas sp. TWI662 TaxID=3136789 RepID=UPI00320B8A8D
MNNMPNNQSSEAGSARSFAGVARPVTAVTGREVGADIVNLGSGNKPFAVFSFRLGDSNSVEAGQVYRGPGVRTAIVHTHPANRNFSGSGNAVWNRGWRGSFATSGDMERALSAEANAYVSLPDRGILKFDFIGMSSDRTDDNVLNAKDYITRLP